MEPFAKSYTVLKDQLIAGEYPSSKNADESMHKLERICASGIHAVINLMEETETDRAGQRFVDYTANFSDCGIDVYRFAIEDLSIPTKQQMTAILNRIDVLINSGKTGYVHCWGGIGRTGTVVGCYLLEHKIASQHNVFSKIADLKKESALAYRESPETNEQKAFVLDWASN